MAAVAGVLFTDLVGLTPFWQVTNQTYAFDFTTLAAIQVAVFAVLEGLRYDGYKRTGGCGVATIFPFDPMNMRSDDKALKELKNGRLAMLAFIGFCSQAAVNGKGPIACLADHIADPWHNNIYTSSVGKETCVTVVLLSIWPMIIEATKKDKKNGEPLLPWNEPWNQA